MITLAPTAAPLPVQIGAPPSALFLALQATPDPIIVSNSIGAILIAPQVVAVFYRVLPVQITVGGPFAPSGRRILGLFRDNRLAPAQVE